MKRSVLVMTIAGCILLGTQSMAQKIKSSAVPAVVRNAFAKKYPTVTKVTWEKEDGNYEANWGGKTGEDVSVQFSPNGTFVEQEVAISVSKLPAGVAQYVKANYKGAKITEADKMTDAKGVITYEAEVNGKDLIFDEQGKFLKAGD